MRCVGVRRVEVQAPHRDCAGFVYSKHRTRLPLAFDGLTHDVVILRPLQTDLARIAPPVFLKDVPDMPGVQSLTDSILVTARP